MKFLAKWLYSEQKCLEDTCRFQRLKFEFNVLFLCFMALPSHFHAQFFLAGHFDSAMKIVFRKSVEAKLPLGGSGHENPKPTTTQFLLVITLS